MKTIKIKNFHIYSDSLDNIRIDCNKQIINTINAHSYVVAKKDNEFEKALISSDVLLPDGEGIVFMAKFLKRKKIHKIAGADIHTHLLTEANSKGLKCFYLGSSQKTLDIIKSKQEEKYPNITFEFYSPPFKSEFTKDENKLMLKKFY